MAVAAWCGARFVWAVNPAVGLTIALVGVLARKPWWLVVACALLAGWSMHRTTSHLSGAPDVQVDEVVEIANDPEARGAAIRVDVEAQGFRWEAWAAGPAGWVLEDAADGERWHVRGRTTAADEGDRRWLWPRRAAGRMTVSDAWRVDDGNLAHRAANTVRALVADSARGLSTRDQALLGGFVYGDDRRQPAEVVDDFRATGLTHLLAVSGSNVAMVLAIARPALRRVPGRWRAVAIAALLAEFIVLTRGEPSVMRACVLAVLATGADMTGRQGSPLRLLSLAVVLLVLYDPMLTRSVGFQLSVAASVGIATLARPIESRLRGPRWYRAALSVTAAAQVGVAPVQITTFGSLPLISLPANLLAAPAAGPTMVWGAGAGVAGGLVGEPWARVLHLPTRLLLWWVAGIARAGARIGGPAIDRSEVLPVLMIGGMWLLARWLLPRRRRGLATGACIAALVVAQPIAAMSLDTAHLSNPSAEPRVVVVDRPDAAWALSQLRGAGIDQIDVLVARSPSIAGDAAVRAIVRRVEVLEVWAPRAISGVKVTIIRDEQTVSDLVIAPVDGRLAVGRSG